NLHSFHLLQEGAYLEAMLQLEKEKLESERAFSTLLSLVAEVTFILSCEYLPALCMLNATMLPEKGLAPVSLSAPAINTGGHDAISPAVSGVPVSSSALDLIKKKLQASTTPVTSSHTAPTGPISSE
ncbi:hypothetical protein Tco_0021715, partial [Tanacetum coccineum]